MAPFTGGAVSVLLYVLYLNILISSAIDIFQSPQNTTVFQDQMPAVFECEVNGEFAGWRVNATPFNSLSPEIRGDLDTDRELSDEGNELLTLTIPGRAEYNGTTVQCITGMIGVGDVIESDSATMKVQGNLSSVADLRTSGNDRSVNISWTAPFSLDVTDVDPDIWYSVLIYNVTDEPTAVPCTGCINITETHYTFTPDYPSPCQEYIFTVIPLNGAGRGETSHNVSGYTIYDRDLNVKVFTKAIDSSSFQIVFTISGAVCGYSLTGVDQSSITDTQLLLNEEDGIDIIYTLSANINDASFEVSNAATSRTVSFTTFDVQIVTVTTTGNEIFVTAVFATDSSAIGLFVVLQCEDGSPDEFRAVLREGQGESGITVPPSTYTLLAYDLEENFLPHDNVAFISPETIIVEDENPNTATTSEFIKGASISTSGSTVEITCELSEDYPAASCVLVYREYGNTTLVVVEYTRDKPDNIIVLDKSDRAYTFAIFGKNGNAGIDPKPVTTKRYMYAVATTATTTEEPSQTLPSEQKSPTAVIGAVITAVIVVVIAIGIVLVLIVLVRKRARGKMEEAQNEDSECSPRSITPLVPDVPDGPSEREEESKYTSVMAVFAVTSPPIVDPPVQYAVFDPKATKRQAHPHGLLYAELGAPPPYSKRPTKPPSTKSTTQYVDVLPHSIPTDNTASDTKQTNKEMTEEKPVEKSVTVEAVMSLLLAVAGLWKAIAEGLGFSENHIDEIDTNDDTDEACLQNCVEQWVNKLDPTWQKLSCVLSDMGQESLAQQALQNEGHNYTSHSEDETSFLGLPEEESADSGYHGAKQVVNGSCVQPQTTHNEDETRGSKTAVENNAEPSDNVDVTRTCFTLMEDTNAIFVHNIPSQYTAEPELPADDSAADEDNEDQCVQPTMECCDDSSKSDSFPVYGGSAYPSSLNPVSGNNAVSLGNGIQVNETEMVPDQQQTDHCHFVLSHEPVSPSILNCKCDKDSTRDFKSQVGPVTVVPQACSELAVTAHPTTSRPTGTPFYYEPQCAFVDEIRSTYSIEQSTKISQQEEIEIAIAPFYVSREYGMVTGLSLTRPCPAMERCDNTTADEEAAPQPAPSMPADNTLAPEPTLEKRQPKKNIPHARWTGRKMIDKVVTFFSDPPENYHQKMLNGASLGFHGPGFMRSFGSSHYG